MTKSSDYPFGDMVFSLPNRVTPTRDGKSTKAADLHVMTNFGLELVTAVWATPIKTATESGMQYGVGLPRGLRAIQDDPISAAIVERFRAEAIDAFDKWYDDAVSATPVARTASTSGRMVRPIKSA